MAEDINIPARYFKENNEDWPVSLDAYLNRGGLITISITDDAWIEISPNAAKQLIARLNSASKDSIAELLSADN